LSLISSQFILLTTGSSLGSIDQSKMNSDLKRVRDGQASDDVASGSPVLKKRTLGTPPRAEVKSEGMLGDWMEVVEVS